MATGFVQKVSKMDQPIDEMSLIQAVQDDSISAVQDLLEKNVDVMNYCDSENKSALYYAIKNKNSVIVKLLLDYGAYIYDSTNYNEDEIVADLAIQIYDLEGKILNANEKIIANLIEEEILNDCIQMLNDCVRMFWRMNHKKLEMPKTSLHTVKEGVKKKICVLLNRLADRNSSNYKDANTFIQFLETFSFDDDETRVHVEDLKSEFLKDDSAAYESIKNFRNAVLQKKRRIYDPESIFDSIRDSFVGEKKDSEVDNKIQFYDKLETFLKRFINKHPKEPFENDKISNFFKCPKKQIGDIINKGRQDNANDKIIYKKFMNLIIKAFKNDTDEEEFWFEFNVNICRCLGIMNNIKDSICDIKKEILDFRNKSVHSFVQCILLPENYKSGIFWLRDALFKYYYAKKLHEGLRSGITWRVQKIEEEICKDFENILNEFTQDINPLSKGTSANCLYYNQKLVLVPMMSILRDQILVESYFMFMPIIEYAIKNEREKSAKNDLKQYLVLDVLSRRQFLERFEDIKKCKEKNDEEKYLQEKERLVHDLSAFGVGRKYVEKIFRYYLEEGKKLNDAVIVIIKNIVEFMRHIGFSIIYEEIEGYLIDIVENILTNPIDLIPEGISNIPKVQKLVRTFTSVRIQDIKVDVKTTIKTMVETLCNYSYLYAMEKKFNEAAIFSSKTFLNVLINEEKKLWDDYNKSLGTDNLRLFKPMRLYTLINQLIKIDYMSPFIVKLLKDVDIEDSEFIKSLIDEDMMRKLIKNLANKDRLQYLGTLLLIEFEAYNLCTLLYDYIIENIKNLDLNEENEPHIFSIFKDDFSYFHSTFTCTLLVHFDYIKGFADVLTSSENQQSFDYIEEIIIPFLKIINEEVEEHLSYRHSERTECNILSEVLLKSIEIEHKFSKRVDQFTPCYVHFIERDILQAKVIISSAEYDASKVINLLKSVIDKLDTCEDTKHREKHRRYKLLIFGLFPDISKFIGLDYQHLYGTILKYVNGEDYEDTDIENVARIYKEIKYNKIYKELLSTSQLLSSFEHLNVLRLPFSWISAALQDIQHRECDFKDDDAKKLRKILEVYQGIYSLDMSGYFDSPSRMFADIYKQLGIVCEARGNYDEASSYCLKALARFKLLFQDSLNGIDNDVLTVFITYISAQYNFSKTLTNKQDLKKRENILKKVDGLCKRFLYCDKHSFAMEKWPKQYETILLISEKVCFDRAMIYEEKN